MTTARKIIKKSMQKIGALVKNEDPSADEANDALDSLNALIESWSNDSLNIYVRGWETFPLTSADTYTIGTGGDFNTTRPTNIISAYTRAGSIDYPVNIKDDEAFNTIPFKSLSSGGYASFMNYDGGYPLGKIRIFPIPSASFSIFLLTEKPLSGFTTLDTELSMPPGTERALIYNLGIELAPEYSQPITAEHTKIASDSLGLIRTKTAQVRGMDAYPRNIAIRNIYSGYWN